MKVFTSKTQKVGEFGENLAVQYLIAKGFSILDRNYTKKWGEIDIIAKKANKNSEVIHFIEVKSVSCESFGSVSGVNNSTDLDLYRPEDNMSRGKIVRLKRTIRTCLLEFERLGNSELDGELDWQFDLICVYLDKVKRRARIRFMEDIVL